MNKGVYLPGLNGIRAIAALMVVIAHFPLLFGNYVGFSFSIYHERTPGSLAVTLFFVLSGYLITYLLILEKEKFKKIDLKAFYLRRILRIWPLYYLVIVLSVIVMFYLYNENLLGKNSTSLKEIMLYLFFAGNYAQALYTDPLVHGFSILGIIWSVGVEEQFYLFWPLLLKYFKKSIRVLIIFFVAYGMLKIIIRIFFVNTFLSPLINLTRLDCMAIGAIGACLVLDPRLYAAYVSRFIFNRYVQVLSWLVFVIGFILLPMPLSIFSDDFYSVFFIIIIINVSQNKKTLISLESGIFNFLGRISYGIYMYHVMIMFVFQKLVPKPADNIFNYFLYLFIVIFLTIAVAYLSNRYIESWFLKKKSLIAKIKSQN
ncbi:MAG: acyltransferase [Ferruginibacter sp.]